MNAKKCLALLLSGCMAASMLAGCWNGNKKVPSSSSGGSNTTGGSIIWIDPDYDKDDDKDDGGASQDYPKLCTIKLVGVGENGTVDPAPTQVVNAGTDVTFTVTANDGYYIQSVKIDDDTVAVNDDSRVTSQVITLQNVSTNRTVTVTLAEVTYTITAKVDGEKGSITPSEVTVKQGDSVTFTISRPGGYDIESLTVNGEDKVDDVKLNGLDNNTYILSNVQANTEIIVSFAQSKTETALTFTADAVPNKKVYAVGETFEPAGLKMEATYENGDKGYVTLTNVNSKVKDGTGIMNGHTESVTIVYNGEEYIYTLPASVTVTPTQSAYGESKYLSETDFIKVRSTFESCVTDIWERKVGTADEILSLLNEKSSTEAYKELRETYGTSTRIVSCPGEDVEGVCTNIIDAVVNSVSADCDSVYMTVADNGEKGTVVCSIFFVDETGAE